MVAQGSDNIQQDRFALVLLIRQVRVPLLGQLIQTASLGLGTPIPSTSECPEYPIVCGLVTATSVLRQEWEQVKPTWTLHALYSPFSLHPDLNHEYRIFEGIDGRGRSSDPEVGGVSSKGRRGAP